MMANLEDFNNIDENDSGTKNIYNDSDFLGEEDCSTMILSSRNKRSLTNENENENSKLTCTTKRSKHAHAMTFMMTEKWDAEQLDIILRRTDLLSPTQLSLLQHVQRNLDFNGYLKVEYSLSEWCKTSGYKGGRVYGKGLQRTKGWIRRLCSHKFYWDLDLVNCHPEIFVQQCEKKSIDVPLWKDYCSNRGERLQNVNSDPKVAKEAVIQALYGAKNLKDYCLKLATEKNKAVDTLWNDPEFSVLRDSVLNFPKYDGENKKKDPKNTFLSMILTNEEKNIIDHAKTYLGTQNIKVGVNCFDGLMVHKEDINESDIQPMLRELESYCSRLTKYDMRFDMKSLVPRPDDKQNLRHPFNDYEQPNLKNVDRIFNQLRYRLENISEEELNKYEQETVKPNSSELDHVHNKIWYIFTKEVIKEMNMCFAFVTKESKGYIMERDVSNGEIQYIQRSEKDTRSIYSNRNFSFSSYKGKPKNIIDMWIRSPMRLEYDRVVFNPCPNDHKKAALPNELNLFTGLAHVPTLKTPFDSKQIEGAREGPLKPFCDHVLEILCKGDQTCYEYVMQWFAASIITPWRKLRTCVILRGEEGLGKGTIIQILIDCLGKKYISQPSDLDAILSGFNANEVEGKLFIFLDEAVYGGCKKSTGKLKKLITEDYFNSEQKFQVRRKIENFASIAMASNEIHVVNAGRNSRRWLALDCSNKYAGGATNESTAYFSKIRNETKPQLLVNYLFSILDKKWDENILPITTGTCGQRIESLDDSKKFILDFLSDPDIIRGARLGSTFNDTPFNDTLEGSYSRSCLYRLFNEHITPGKYKPTQSKLITTIKECIGAEMIDTMRTHLGTRSRIISFPFLVKARSEFEKQTGLQKHNWE